MAYDEYLDLYLKAQENINAPYYVVSFDVVGSSRIEPIKRQKLQENLFKTMKYVYSKLIEKELDYGMDILIKDERFYRGWELGNKHISCDFADPYIFGDVIEFTVKRGTVSKDDIISLFNEAKSLFGIEEEFHINDGYYETNEYGEGGNLFYRGYCLATLESLHKQRTQNKIKSLKRKIR